MLVGPLAVDKTIPDNEDDIEKLFGKGSIKKGGAWWPTKCIPVSKVNFHGYMF